MHINGEVLEYFLRHLLLSYWWHGSEFDHLPYVIPFTV